MIREKNFYNKNFINYFSKDIIEVWKNNNLIYFKKSEIIIRPESDSEYVYLIVSGEANIFHIHEDGKECIINIMEEGEFIQLFDIFTNIDSNVVAKALSDMVIAKVSKADIIEEVLKDGDLALSILNDFSLRIQDLVEMLSQIAYGKVEKRLMILLDKLSNKKITDGNWAIIETYITHQDMAGMIGSTRETITLLMNKLTKEGILKQKDSKIWLNLEKM